MAATIIPLRELRIGAKLPAAIYDANNPDVMLLNSGLTLTRYNIDRLKQRGIKAVSIDSRYVDNIIGAASKRNSGPAKTSRFSAHSRSEDRKKRERGRQPLTERLIKPVQPEYNESLVRNIEKNNEQHKQRLQSFYEDVQANGRVRIEPVQNVSTDSIDMLLTDIDLFVNSAINSTDQSQHNADHSCRVAKLAMSITAVLGYPEEDVCQIGIGCMVARIGIDEKLSQLLNSKRVLTPLERLELKKYPALTWHTLEKITDMTSIARQVSWQINERWNGSGYPRGRVGKQIHPLARIAAVSDVYIAMTSQRPHREAVSPYRAVTQILQATQRGQFEPDAVRGLLKTTSLFPIGSYVELSNGTMAQVLRTDTNYYDRPTVQPLYDFRGDAIPKTFLDLAVQDELKIIDAISESEAMRKIQSNAIKNSSIDMEMDWADQMA